MSVRFRTLLPLRPEFATGTAKSPFALAELLPEAQPSSSVAKPRVPAGARNVEFCDSERPDPKRGRFSPSVVQLPLGFVPCGYPERVRSGKSRTAGPLRRGWKRCHVCLHARYVQPGG